MSCFLAVVLLLLPATAIADYADTDWPDDDTDDDSPGTDDDDNGGPNVPNGAMILLWEEFWSDFPPDGWTVVATNPDATWRKSSSCDVSQSSCALVDAVGSDADELLVSPPMVCAGCKRVKLIYDSLDRIGDDADFDSLTAQISYDFGTADSPVWTDVSLDFTVTPGKTFWIGFRYTGAGSLGWEIDNVVVAGTPLPPGDGDDDDDGGCGCQVSRSETSVALTLVMLTIGLAAFVASQRVGSSRKRSR
jgi:hypothetical protein